MRPQAFQNGEIRDENDVIIRAGAYGKLTAFVNGDNTGILDYIINNFDVIKDAAGEALTVAEVDEIWGE